MSVYCSECGGEDGSHDFSCSSDFERQEYERQQKEDYDKQMEDEYRKQAEPTPEQPTEQKETVEPIGYKDLTKLAENIVGSVINIEDGFKQFYIKEEVIPNQSIVNHVEALIHNLIHRVRSQDQATVDKLQQQRDKAKKIFNSILIDNEESPHPESCECNLCLIRTFLKDGEDE